MLEKTTFYIWLILFGVGIFPVLYKKLPKPLFILAGYAILNTLFHLLAKSDDRALLPVFLNQSGVTSLLTLFLGVATLVALGRYRHVFTVLYSGAAFYGLWLAVFLPFQSQFLMFNNKTQSNASPLQKPEQSPLKSQLYS